MLSGTVASRPCDGTERDRERKTERKEGSSRLASRLYLDRKLNLERESGRNSKTKEEKERGAKAKAEGNRKEETYGREPTSSDRLRRYNSKNISMLRQ